ncbi:MAG: DUF3488 and transglutaminase-like domain-containing protein [Actinomycetota bacterium]
MPDAAAGRVGGQRAARPRFPVEDSIMLRAVVLACVLVGVAALVAQRALDPQTALAAFLLIPAGFAFSYVRRYERNIPVKIVLAAGMIISLGVFMSAVQRAHSVDQARVMLASLFVWVQVMHSFDLPRRKDLAYSMVSSLVLMAAAASLTLSTGYGLFVLTYLPLAGAWLMLSARAKEKERADPTRLRREPGAPAPRAARPLVVTGVIAVASAVLVFAAVPRVSGIQVVAPPFELGSASSVPDFTGSVVNPGVPQDVAPGQVTPFLPNAYPGFGDSVDLRARGRLSEDVVMKVRAAQPAFWRGQVYDAWDGVRWTASDTETERIFGQAPIKMPVERETRARPFGESLLQTFFIERQQPNLVFAAYRPTDIWFPANELRLDIYDSLRSPILLDEGLTYSVESMIPAADPDQLRTAPDPREPELIERYTQLPPELPQRVRDLAHRITDGQPTTYDKVIAVERWLRENTRYNLDIPPDPVGVDAVDHFLFETREGFCEHLASSMALMLRSVGIPARFVVGFDAGERNPLTGYFEVRESDAHSWVEVYYPTIGWMEYDPTHEVPLANPGLEERFAGAQIFSAIGRFMGSLVPQSVKDAMGSVFSGVAGAAKSAAANWPIVLGAAAALAAVVAVFGRRRRLRRRGPPPTGATAAFLAVCDAFAARGRPRPPQRTPDEYLRELLASDDLAREHADDLRRIVDTFERDRFARSGPDLSEVKEALAAATRLGERRKDAPALG